MTVSVFEICIRFLGGLLTSYALTEDEVKELPGYTVYMPSTHDYVHKLCCYLKGALMQYM